MLLTYSTVVPIFGNLGGKGKTHALVVLACYFGAESQPGKFREACFLLPSFNHIPKTRIRRFLFIFIFQGTFPFCSLTTSTDSKNLASSYFTWVLCCHVDYVPVPVLRDSPHTVRVLLYCPTVRLSCTTIGILLETTAEPT